MTTAHPIMLPTGQKDLTRRAVLAASAASFGLLLPPQTFRAAITPVHQQDRDPHPISALPFVRGRSPQEQLSGADPRCFWAVQPTGDYGHDCATGAQYAELALEYMLRSPLPELLQWAVFDMMTLGRAHSGVEVGFMSAFGRIATQAHQANLAHKSG